MSYSTVTITVVLVALALASFTAQQGKTVVPRKWEFQESLFIILTDPLGPCSITYKVEFIAAANFYRAKHGVPPLTLDPFLLEIAIRQVYYCAIVRKPELDPTNHYSTTVFSNKNVAMIYDEGRGYPYGSEPSADAQQRFRSFAHLMWRNVTKVGVGCIEIGSTLYGSFVTAPGCWGPGQWKANVLPPKGLMVEAAAMGANNATSSG